MELKKLLREAYHMIQSLQHINAYIWWHVILSCNMLFIYCMGWARKNHWYSAEKLYYSCVDLKFHFYLNVIWTLLFIVFTGRWVCGFHLFLRCQPDDGSITGCRWWLVSTIEHIRLNIKTFYLHIVIWSCTIYCYMFAE